MLMILQMYMQQLMASSSCFTIRRWIVRRTVKARSRNKRGTGTLSTFRLAVPLVFVHGYADEEVGRHVRTRKQPVQPIPRFEELIALIMEVSLRRSSGVVLPTDASRSRRIGM